MKLALSMLCENPQQRTGLTTTFHEFVSRSVRLCPDVSWLLFLGPKQPWTWHDPRVQLVRDFASNDRMLPRLLADHLRVPAVARAHGVDALVTVGFVPWRKLVPTVMHIFSLQHLDSNNRIGWGRRLYRYWVMHRSWPKADLIITNSDFAARQILSVFPNFESRLVRSYEGLQHEQFNTKAEPRESEQLQARLGIKPGYLLWISNLYPYKQPELLLRAFALLAPEEQAAHPLIMVGGDWVGVLDRCRALAIDLGINSHVHFVGWIEEKWLAPLYRHALAYCLPSREETFGRGVIEAMACGLPCIVNDIPIMHEVTAGAAVVIDFADTPGVVRALRRLMKEPEFRQELVDAGLRNAQRFDFDTLTIERIAAIRRFISGPGGGRNTPRSNHK